MPGSVGVFAKVTSVLDWVKKVTENCNEKICNEVKNCSTNDTLDSSITIRLHV